MNNVLSLVKSGFQENKIIVVGASIFAGLILIGKLVGKEEQTQSNSQNNTEEEKKNSQVSEENDEVDITKPPTVKVSKKKKNKLKDVLSSKKKPAFQTDIEVEPSQPTRPKMQKAEKSKISDQDKLFFHILGQVNTKEQSQEDS